MVSDYKGGERKTNIKLSLENWYRGKANPKERHNWDYVYSYPFIEAVYFIISREKLRDNYDYSDLTADNDFKFYIISAWKANGVQICDEYLGGFNSIGEARFKVEHLIGFRPKSPKELEEPIELIQF
jgi:hypothetical protein